MLLERYSDRILSFDDDIQGTGAVALAALMTAMRIKGQRFRDQRFAITGMGQAGTGIATNIRTMLLQEGASEDEARSRISRRKMPGVAVTPGSTVGLSLSTTSSSVAGASRWRATTSSR